jgi:hypothetical protein
MALKGGVVVFSGEGGLKLSYKKKTPSCQAEKIGKIFRAWKVSSGEKERRCSKSS